MTSLPLLPLPEACPPLHNVSWRYHIPRIIWFAVKNASEELPAHLVLDFLPRNAQWRTMVVGNRDKDNFIDTVFNGTRVQWMYNAIHPSLGAAKADIWRYAALWCYGGFYLDFDANMKTSLDDIVQANDTLIMGEDGTTFFDYFRAEFALSDNATFRGGADSTMHIDLQPYITSHDPNTGWPRFFHNRFILNWAIFSTPRSPIWTRTMTNIFKILWSEHIRESVVAMTTSHAKYLLLLFCTCFPLTFSVRQLLLERTPGFRPRVCAADFREYGGRCKAMSTSHDRTHYRSVIKKTTAPELLRTYKYNATSAVGWVEGWTVMAHVGGKSVFMVRGGVKVRFTPQSVRGGRCVWFVPLDRLFFF